MATITVGHKLEKERALAGDHPITRILDCLRRSNDIHAIRLDTRYLISTSEILGVG